MADSERACAACKRPLRAQSGEFVAVGIAYGVSGPDYGPDRIVFGFGLSGEIAPSLSLGVRYEGSVSEDADSHRATIGANWRF